MKRDPTHPDESTAGNDQFRPVATSGLASRLDALFLIRPGERGVVVLSVAAGFLLFCAYSVLKPIRDAMAVGLDDHLIKSLITWSPLVMLGVTLVVSLAVSRLSWRRFVPAVHGLWVVGTLGFALTFWSTPNPSPWLASTFYVCVSILSLISMSFLWSLLGGVFAAEQAQRLFPSIGMGVTLGGIAGAGIVSWLAKSTSHPVFMLIAAALFAGAFGCVVVLLRADRSASAEFKSSAFRANLAADAVDGLKHVALSWYLQRLALYILLYAVASTVLYLEQRLVIKSAFADLPAAEAKAAQTGALANIDLWANILTIALQLLAAGRIIRFLGQSVAMAVTPLTSLLGLLTLFLSPGLAPLMAVQVGRRGLHYAIDRPCREALYTVVSPTARHKSKSFIDTVVYRLGDALGPWVEDQIKSPAGGVTGLGVGLAAAACAVWTVLGFSLGRSMSKRRERFEKL